MEGREGTEVERLGQSEGKGGGREGGREGGEDGRGGWKGREGTSRRTKGVWW